jgi:hypothetical protein
MLGYITATGLFSALSTFQIVGRIDGSATWTDVVFLDFPEPLFITNRFDSFQIGPKFDSMRHR